MSPAAPPIERRTYGPAVAVVLASVSSALFLLRLYARSRGAVDRSRNNSGIGLDDICIAIGWIFGLALTAGVILVFSRYGFDLHIEDVPPNLWVPGFYVSFLCELFFFLSTSFTKIACMLFYLRIIDPLHNRRMLWAIRIGIAVIATYAFVFTLLPLVTCRPLSARWDQANTVWAETHEFVCVKDSASGPISGAISAATDLYAVLIPLMLLSGLKMPFRAKVGLYAVFAVGFLAVGAGVARAILLFQLYSGASDTTWIGFPVFLCCLYEFHLALCCACVPALRQIFLREIKPFYNGSLKPRLKARHSGLLLQEKRTSLPASQVQPEGGDQRVISRLVPSSQDGFQTIPRASFAGADSRRTTLVPRPPSPTLSLPTSSNPASRSPSPAGSRFSQSSTLRPSSVAALANGDAGKAPLIKKSENSGDFVAINLEPVDEAPSDAAVEESFLAYIRGGIV